MVLIRIIFSVRNKNLNEVFEAYKPINVMKKLFFFFFLLVLFTNVYAIDEEQFIEKLDTLPQDKRTKLLNSPNRVGYGAAATGGTNYVFPTNEAQFRQMINTAGNYVVISSNYANTEWGLRAVGYIASNVTIDGSDAPGFVLFPDYANGFPSSAAGNSSASVFATYNENNIIIHALILKGYRSPTYNASDPSFNTGGLNIRSTDVFIDHVEVTDFWDDALHSAQAGDYITISHMKVHNTDKGISSFNAFNGNWDRHYTIHNSLLAAVQRNPANGGAHFLHMFNNLIQGSTWQGLFAGTQADPAFQWTGDCYTISEHNVFKNNGTDIYSYTAGTGAIVVGHVESVNDSYNTSFGNVTNSTVPSLFSINYSYNGFLKNTSVVEAYVLQNAGEIPVNSGGAIPPTCTATETAAPTSGGNNGVATVIVQGGATPYTYLWDDPQGQTTAVANGLSAGNYTVEVTDATNCKTQCSVTLTGSSTTCNVSVWLEGAFDMNTIQLNNGLQQAGMLPSGQPYNAPFWNYFGTEGDGWQQSDYPAGSIDWILISLRTTPQPCTEVVKVAALLMEDGTIVPASIELNGIAHTAFYLVVEHRNHIPVMTPTAIPLVNNTLSYDFRTANSYNAGTGFGQTQLGGQWAMFAGDISQDSPVGYEVTGADQILWQAANGNFSVYRSEDTNLDGDVNGMDRILLNLNNGISSTLKKCFYTTALGCATAGVNGNLSVEVPLPAGGAYWDNTSPFWSVTEAGSPFNFTPYLGTGPYAFSLNGLPDGDYCANFEGTPLDANGAPLPIEYAQCCFVVSSTVPTCTNSASPAPFFQCPSTILNTGDPLSIDLAATLPSGADSVVYQLINGSGTIQGSNYVENSLTAGVHAVEIERCYSIPQQDKRTRLLNSPNRVGYGASATGGTNYVFPTNEAQFRQMINTPGNYVCISSAYANTEWGMRGPGYIASNVTIDGSDAPGFALFPDYANGFPSTAAGNNGTAILSTFSDDNIIVHSLILKGYRSGSYDSNHPSYNTGGMNIRSSNVFVDHVEITDFWDDAITSAQAGDYITMSHMKIHNTDKGIQFYLPFSGNWDRHYTIHNSLLAGRQRNPWNTGAHFLHFFNNLIQDADYGAVVGGRLQSQGSWNWTGDCYSISERNVYLNNLAYDMRGYNSSVIVEGHIESVNDSYSSSNGTVTQSGTPTLFPINYNYSGFLKNTSAVQAYVLQNAGALTSSSGGGSSRVCAQQTCCIAVQ